MTHFPTLPPLPDIAAPFRTISEGVKQAVEGLREADKAALELKDLADHGREVVDKIMKRPLRPTKERREP